eukprot:TRINITY_DN823_c0_g1_i2.p1 TRINITY_DN823_c0_g1~~TRINITY_DN823_c0_g1_i2.p1  ORF type:complete len:311 (-),score=38.93 TRINITY_DN823_c0_g1_i2:2253-3185(-)
MGGGGGAILRAADRAVGAGIGPGVVPTVKPKPTGFLSVPSSSVTLPVSVTSTVASNRSVSRFVHEEDDWEHIQEEEEVDDGIGVSGFSPRHVFGTVPSREEVETALSTLQQYTKTIENRFGSTTMKDGADQMMNATNFAHGVSSTNWHLNWAEPAFQIYNPQSAQSQGYDHMFNAFHLLQINPSVQRMVASLSSDKAVWDAVMNNEAVKELKESFYTAGSNDQLESSKEESEAVTQFLRWILDNTKAKIAEIIDKIAKLMNDLFQPSEKERVTDIFMDTLRSSLMLSVMVLLVVVITRVQRAWTRYRIPM